MKRADLERHLAEFLQPERFKDYCPNGLQVEGRDEVRTLVTGVSASLAFLQAAHGAGADAVLVHHGYFWRGEDPRITGLRRQRIGFLVAHDISLFGFHLPLDAHPVCGNNTQLARRLGLVEEGRGGEQDLVCHGRPGSPLTVGEFAAHAARVLGREPLLIGDAARPLARLAWCTGGAQGFFEDALGFGIDAYLTGEISEQHVHLAREAGVAFIAAGHHATERYGVQALGAHLAAQFGLAHRFIEIPNPV